MGKGDIKSKRGKIVNGTYGVRRKKKATKAAETKVVEKPKKKVEEKAEKKVEEKAD